MKLECMQTFSLFGEIVSLQAVRFTGSSHDALLLSFKDAKVRWRFLIVFSPLGRR